MVLSCISESEKAILKSLIGKKLLCIKSELKDSWNRIFGNLAVITQDSEVEVRNELTETVYFDDMEDVSKFKIRQITSDKPFKLMVEVPVVETKIKETISDIMIIQDVVSVKNSEESCIYEITMDDAVIIKTTESAWVISREWCLEEELIFVKSANYKDSVYSIDDIVAEWSDEDEGIKATCKRTEVSLANN